MKALAYQGPRAKAWEDVADPALQATTGAICPGRRPQWSQKVAGDVPALQVRRGTSDKRLDGSTVGGGCPGPRARL